MESGQSLKRRMKSVQNIGQITKAMELVEATKMRKSQEVALNSRPFAYAALELLAILSSAQASIVATDQNAQMPEILRERPIQRTAFLLMTSDKGLAGSFNSSVFRKFENYVKANQIDLNDPKYSFIAVGQKAKSYIEHRGLNVIHSFSHVGDVMELQEVDSLSSALIGGYIEREFDQVISFSTNFVTALRQEVFVRQILPINFEKIKESIELLIPEAGKYSQYLVPAEKLEEKKHDEYVIEPSAKEVLEELAPKLLKIRVYHAILEANASEHSARRMAMKNASDNASDLFSDLTMVYNKSRQAAITAQIIEITSGAQQ
jgi:F-type H+-transporting ATPase subunit gamma